MKLRKLGALAFSAMLVAAACNTGGGATPTSGATPGPTDASTDAPVDKGTVKIAIELPMQGSELAASQPIVNGIKLAVKDAGGSVGGYKVEVPAVFDDAINGAHDAQQGAKNMLAIVSDPDIIAVIGPLNSSVAKVQIPISNEAGLLQCSPANTSEGLTKPDFGGLLLRSKFPERIAYVRVVTTDDKQGPAAAKYLFEKVGAKSVYIIDDTETFGKGIADNFETEFKKLGGTVVGHDGAPKTTTDYSALMTAAKALNPEGIYFGGVTATGGARILKAAVQAGMGDIPYVGPDGIQDGSALTKDSFLNLAGEDAKNSYSTLAAIGDFPGKAEFDAKYLAEYGEDPGSYSGTGYACATIVLDALKRAAATNPTDNAGLKEAVRAAVVDPSVTYATVLGEMHFDENGDTSQLIISIYQYDAATTAWAFKEQIDYAQ